MEMNVHPLMASSIYLSLQATIIQITMVQIPVWLGQITLNCIFKKGCTLVYKILSTVSKTTIIGTWPMNGAN